jgi:hypothetical protein
MATYIYTYIYIYIVTLAAWQSDSTHGCYIITVLKTRCHHMVFECDTYEKGIGRHIWVHAYVTGMDPLYLAITLVGVPQLSSSESVLACKLVGGLWLNLCIK